MFTTLSLEVLIFVDFTAAISSCLLNHKQQYYIFTSLLTTHITIHFSGEAIILPVIVQLKKKFPSL